MIINNKVIVTLTSRLFTDEIVKLQEKIGSIVPLKDTHGLQNIHSVGLGPVCARDGAPDYVLMYQYLAKSNLVVLEEVNNDTLVFNKLDVAQTYQIKNIYKPFFQWDSYSQLVVIPPIFGIQQATVTLESNGTDVVFPSVVPLDVGQDVLQKLLMYNVYSRVTAYDPDAANQAEVLLHTGHITHMGRSYALDLAQQSPEGCLSVLDNLSLYMSILSALLPRACLRLVSSTLRHGCHDLLAVFGGVIPQEVRDIDLDALSVTDDISRMGATMTYLQALSSIFNLGPRLFISSYSPENLTATCWYSVT
ncbi:capsid triplex subunit 2 [Common bottlenose dolphin gammaherpesvirus 1 strain Sarasota]|uniref:Capsid triplex subunit 2 n=1 Tax=Common bottlenose dolphin gammaherpesvirus 1 strain Sarasota TaxID=2022783 RepID=A0A1Z1NE90_9GAMA|nr:capsid triplex subunit 2 [Common bottlenose dolphin gammaherpesvirus 1 strain Sarasota]ARW78089.1 capsid triplex subunit 2 [Common bottlenose dolphin gammaherpesvirus 1 strain Sarasota]